MAKSNTALAANLLSCRDIIAGHSPRKCAHDAADDDEMPTSLIVRRASASRRKLPKVACKTAHQISGDLAMIFHALFGLPIYSRDGIISHITPGIKKIFAYFHFACFLHYFIRERSICIRFGDSLRRGGGRLPFKTASRVIICAFFQLIFSFDI